MNQPNLHRIEVLAELAELIVALRRAHPVRVAIDGVDAAGKTILADELVPILERRGRACIRASVDGFHRPRVERYRRGDDSAEGYYFDSFDYAKLREVLLLPLGPGGDRLYRKRVFDFRADPRVEQAPMKAPMDPVLLLDGVFLLRPELNDQWDFRIFVSASFEETLRRAITRDEALFGSSGEARARYERRYIPGQRLYLETVMPERLADAVVVNDDPALPVLRRRVS